MIVREILAENTDLVRTCSDQNLMIHKVGTDEYYGEAIDLATSPYVYEETDQPIESDEGGEEEQPTENLGEIEAKAQAYDILLGVSE